MCEWNLSCRQFCAILGTSYRTRTSSMFLARFSHSSQAMIWYLIFSRCFLCWWYMIRRAISRSEDSLPRLKLLEDLMPGLWWVTVADAVSSGNKNASACAVKHNNVNISEAIRFRNRFLGNMLLLRLNKQKCKQLTEAGHR